MSRFLLRSAAVVAVLAVLAVGLYAGWQRFGRPVLAIDFTDSIAHEQVHPMDEDRDSIGAPRLVDLRFPGGWAWSTDKAEVVRIQRNYILESELISYVQVEYPRTSLDEAVAEARRFRDHWQIRDADSDLEEWYQEKQRVGPTWENLDRGNGSRWVEGTDLSGKRLLVSFWITGAPGLEPPYRFYAEFDWMSPETARTSVTGAS